MSAKHCVGLCLSISSIVLSAIRLLVIIGSRAVLKTVDGKPFESSSLSASAIWIDMTSWRCHVTVNHARKIHRWFDSNSIHHLKIRLQNSNLFFILKICYNYIDLKCGKHI